MPQKKAIVNGSVILNWEWLAIAVSGCGTLVILAVSWRQVQSLHRVLRCCSADDRRLSRIAANAASILGLKTVPQVTVVEANLSPLLWVCRTGPIVVMPRKLSDQLSDEQLHCILSHEIAHFLRRDHWTNALSLAVTAICWWNPLVWWVRRELRTAQEACCDAIVISRSPALRKTYAQTLFQALEFLQAERSLMPVLASGFGGKSSAQRRFEMIANSHVKHRLSWWCYPVLAAALLALPLVPVLATAQEATIPAGAKPDVAAPASSKQSPSEAEQLAALKAEYASALQAVTKEQKDPKTGEVTGYKMESTVGLEAARYLPKLLQLGECNDEETAVAALSFAILNFDPKEPDVETAFRQLIRRFADSPRLVTFAREQQNHFSGVVDRRLSLLLVSATDHTARGLLEYHLANTANPNFARFTAEFPENTEARRELAAFRYQKVIDRYADVDEGLLARRAANALKALAPAKFLRVGATAPATTGNDLDGKPMSLSDFKGKLIVLEFWGSWCGPCISATPGLKAVAKEYAARDVVVLGVMAEADAAAARKATADLGVPWRNWFDPREDKSSPIVDQWEVFSFPTTVVIDRAGVVRAVNPLGREGLEDVLDKLLAAERVKR